MYCCLRRVGNILIEKQIFNSLKIPVLLIRDVLSLIPHPDFCASRIRDPKTATKERGEKFSCPTFFVATKITKLKIINFELVKT
jgi:hypothetical protein